MNGIAAGVRAIDRVNTGIGRAAAWLIVLCVLICASVAILRYAFGFGRIWLQELYVVCFALSFMLIAPYAYARNRHVRVDIFQQRFPPRSKAWVEILGVLLFLMPWLALIAWSSVAFVGLSWRVFEPSPQVGGLPGFYLVKSVIPLFCLLMALEGLAVIGRNVLILAGREDLLPLETERAPAAAAN